MFKFSKVVVAGLLVGGLLAGCSNSDQASTEKKEEKPTQSEQKPLKQEEPKKNEDGNVVLTTVGQKTKDADAGTVELMKIKNVNQTVQVAPIKVTVKDIKVIKISDVNETFAQNLADYTQEPVERLKKGFSYIQVQYTAENTSDKNIEWYDLMNVVTDKGEQIDGQLKDFLVDDADTDSKFIGKVKKDFGDAFILKNGDISKVKLIFGNTMNGDTYEDITGKQTVEYSL